MGWQKIQQMRGIPLKGIPMPGWEKNTEINIAEALSVVPGAPGKHKPNPEIRYPCVKDLQLQEKNFYKAV